MRCSKSTLSNIVEVGYKNLMIYECSHMPRSHIVHTVKVRYVDTSLVRRRVLFIVLIDIEAKEYNINTIKILEDDDTFASIAEFIGIILVAVSFLHSISNFQLFVHRCHLSNCNCSSTGLNHFLRFFQSNALFQNTTRIVRPSFCITTKFRLPLLTYTTFGLLLRRCLKVFFHFRSHVLLEILRKLGSLEVCSHGSCRGSLRFPGLLAFLYRASRTSILRPLILVLACVKKGTYLMNPSLTAITLNPTFFMNFVILFLNQLGLLSGEIAKFNWLVVLQISKALVAPVILVVTTNIVVAISSDSFRWTVCPVTIENWWFKEKLFTATQQAGFSILSFGVLFCIQLLDECFIVVHEFCFHLFSHVVYDRTFRIVDHCIIEC